MCFLTTFWGSPLVHSCFPFLVFRMLKFTGKYKMSRVWQREVFLSTLVTPCIKICCIVQDPTALQPARHLHLQLFLVKTELYVWNWCQISWEVANLMRGMCFSCNHLGAIRWAVYFLWKDVQACSVADKSLGIFLKVVCTIEIPEKCAPSLWEILEKRRSGNGWRSLKVFLYFLKPRALCIHMSDSFPSPPHSFFVALKLFIRQLCLWAWTQAAAVWWFVWIQDSARLCSPNVWCGEMSLSRP